ncbi:MAG: type IV secretory system conjugative DNA transfer family protein [Ferrimicrobium sp.]
MSQSDQIDTKAETTKLLVMAAAIAFVPIYIGVFTFFAWHNHLIATLSPSDAIAAASRTPRAPVYAAAKDALIALIALGVAILFATLTIRGIHQAKHDTSVDMDNLTRTKWNSYEDLETVATPKALRTMAHMVRGDLFPEPLETNTSRFSRSSSADLEGYPFRVAGNFLGYFVESDGTTSRDKPIWLDYEKSVLIVGPARSGKNYYFLNSMIVDHVGPLVTTCVRSDLVVATARARAEQGPVYILDPDHLIGEDIFTIGVGSEHFAVTRVGWNVLDGCTNPLTVEARVNQIIAGVNQTNGGGNDNVSDFYGSQISPIIKCAFYHTAITDQGIADAMQILTHWGRNVETQTFLATLVASITDSVISATLPALSPLAKPGAKASNRPRMGQPEEPATISIDSTQVPQGVALSQDEQRTIAAWLTSIIPTYNEAANQDTFKAFFTGFLTQSLKAFLTPSLQQLLDPSYGIPSLDVDHFLATQGTLYIVGNLETQKTVAPIIVGLISDLYQRAQSYASRNNPRNPRLQPPLGLYLDEVISLAPLPPDLLTGLLTTGSGSGIRSVLVIQDRRLVSMKWGDAIATSIDANVGALVLLPGIKDPTIIDQYTRLAGEVYVDWETPGSDGLKQGGYRPLLRPEDIRGLARGHALVIISSHGPLEVEGIPFTERAWAKRALAPT